MSDIIFTSDVFYIEDKPRKNVLVETDQGMMIVNRFDSNHHQVGHSIWLLDHGNCNTVEVNDCYQVIKHIENPIIFDVGANIGTISIWLSKMFKTGHVYSFEAQRQIFYQLAGNISINNLYNIDVFNLAVGSENGYINVKEPNYFINNDFGIFSLIEEKLPTTNKNLVVPLITLDTFVKEYEIPKVDLLKIDVEGMDINVLKGSINILEKYQPIIYVEHFDNITSNLTNLKNFLSNFNYNFETRKNNLLCLK